MNESNAFVVSSLISYVKDDLHSPLETCNIRGPKNLSQIFAPIHSPIKGAQIHPDCETAYALSFSDDWQKLFDQLCNFVRSPFPKLAREILRVGRMINL